MTDSSRDFWEQVDARAERIARKVVDERLANAASGGANISITTGSSGIPLVGNVLIDASTAQAFIHVPFPMQLTRVYACLDVTDAVEWAIRVFFPTAIGGSGPASGVDPAGSPLLISGMEMDIDPRAAGGWSNTFLPPGSNIEIFVVSTGGLACVLTVNLIGRVVVR